MPWKMFDSGFTQFWTLHCTTRVQFAQLTFRRRKGKYVSVKISGKRLSAFFEGVSDLKKWRRRREEWCKKEEEITASGDRMRTNYTCTHCTTPHPRKSELLHCSRISSHDIKKKKFLCLAISAHTFMTPRLSQFIMRWHKTCKEFLRQLSI